ncbi:CDP-alcohol phosphatidyltransferase family protein [Ornithinicoccus halotolerans]|uniref:CDP-alcohol phosphatidyltransferase family protein n=1 Tax=Ornithinicoccus halotolerans TaxID=1748220 RepID=UPI001E5D04F3|nr:CDP-alcohol phosphatidyltransferase family protein [Ornithinicoccus halotolerans]
MSRPAGGEPRATAEWRRLRRRTRWWLTWPNAVTIGRVALTIPLCSHLLCADRTLGRAPAPVLLSAVLWAGSDWVDGLLARRLGQRTRIGEVLDPVADRLGILAVCLCLGVIGEVPWWVAGVIALTDGAVTLLAGPSAGRGDVSVSSLGKLRTAVLFGGLSLVLAGVLLQPAVTGAGRTVLTVGVVLHAAAGIGYARRARGGGAALAAASAGRGAAARTGG